MNKDGSLLLECIIYVALFITLSSLLMYFTVTTYKQVKQMQLKTFALHQLYAAHHLMERDLQGAAGTLTDWYHIADHAVVWHTQDNEVGWLWADGNVYRLYGTFDKKSGQWKKRNKNLVAQGIKDLTFKLLKHSQHIQQVQGIEYTITTVGTHYQLSHTVSLHNVVLT